MPNCWDCDSSVQTCSCNQTAEQNVQARAAGVVRCACVWIAFRGGLGRGWRNPALQHIMACGVKTASTAPVEPANSQTYLRPPTHPPTHPFQPEQLISTWMGMLPRKFVLGSRTRPIKSPLPSRILTVSKRPLPSNPSNPSNPMPQNIEITAIIVGMLTFGFVADIIGRKWGSRSVDPMCVDACCMHAGRTPSASAAPPSPSVPPKCPPFNPPSSSYPLNRLTMVIMFVGACLLTGAYGPNDSIFLSVFLFSLFFYAVGAQQLSSFLVALAQQQWQRGCLGARLAWVHIAGAALPLPPTPRDAPLLLQLPRYTPPLQLPAPSVFAQEWAASTRLPPLRRQRRLRLTLSCASAVERWWCWRLASRAGATLPTHWWVGQRAVEPPPLHVASGKPAVQRNRCLVRCCCTLTHPPTHPLPPGQVILLLLAIQGATGDLTSREAELTWRLQVGVRDGWGAWVAGCCFGGW